MVLQALPAAEVTESIRGNCYPSQSGHVRSKAVYDNMTISERYFHPLHALFWGRELMRTLPAVGVITMKRTGVALIVTVT